MTYFRYLLIAIAIVLMGYNATKIEVSDPFNGDSQIALISVFASACVIVLLLILIRSFEIKKRLK
ncbi:MAG: hypothetical protein P8O93_05785 [Flavobacteriaceae bacterium]|jgi:hypothetical protein|nr:hypothetical protein [Flavobacteriaceae bacterium]MDG1962728.1 hypothetical protein [Flavobacteriaceae bacterium]